MFCLQLITEHFEIIVILEGTVESNGKMMQVRNKRAWYRQSFQQIHLITGPNNLVQYRLFISGHGKMCKEIREIFEKFFEKLLNVLGTLVMNNCHVVWD